MRETLVKSEEFKDSPTEKMPEGREVKPLREIADLQVGFAFKSEWFQEHEGIRLLRGENVGYGSPDWSETRRLPWKMCPNYQEYELVAGDIIIGMDRTFTKSGFKISVLEPDDVPALLVQRVGRFIPINCDHQFLKVLLNSQEYHHALLAQQKGMDIPHLSKTEILEPVVAIPPVDEQRQIAEILNTIDEAIARTSSLIAKLKQMKAGLLHDLLTRGLDENGELRDAIGHPQQFKDSPLGQIPKDWETGVLGDVVDPNRPIVYGILMPGYGYPGGIPVVKVKDIINSKIQTSDLLLTSPEIDNNYRRSRLEPGDLLFTIRGTVGRMAFVPEHLRGANITQDTARLAIINADPHFVRQYLEMPKPQAFIELHTIGQAVKGINLRDVRLIPLVVPPTSEQLKIIDICDTYDNRIRAEEAYRDKLKLQKTGLMHDLLTGRIRVKDAQQVYF